MSSLKNILGTDRFLSLLLIVLAIIAYGLIGNTEEVFEAGELKASTYPRILLAGLMIACALQIFRGGNEEQEKAKFPLRGLIAIAVIAGYIALLDIVGYFLLTPVVLIALPILAGFRDVRIIGLSVVLVMAALYAVFGLILKIPLPTGFLGG